MFLDNQSRENEQQSHSAKLKICNLFMLPALRVADEIPCIIPMQPRLNPGKFTGII
jgi:hypothetical protein